MQAARAVKTGGTKGGRPREGFIYFIITLDPFLKIGFTIDPEKRLVAMRNPNRNYPHPKGLKRPVILRYCLFVEGTIRQEHLLHVRFKAELVDGCREWFHCGGETESFLERLEGCEEDTRAAAIAEFVRGVQLKGEEKPPAGSPVACPHCGRSITRAEIGAMLTHMRVTRAGGRPRSKLGRCPCGLMTAKRAKARGHKCEPGGAI